MRKGTGKPRRGLRKTGLLLTMVLLLNTVFANNLFAEPEESQGAGPGYVGDFNLYTDRADDYLEEDSLPGRVIQSMQETTMPSLEIVNCTKDSSFQSAVQSWKAAHFVTTPEKLQQGAWIKRDTIRQSF